MSGYTGTQFEEYYSLATSVVSASWTTSKVISAPGGTAVGRCMIPALFFDKIGKSIHFEANGILQATATTVTFTPLVGLDPTAGTLGATLATIGTYTTATATTNLPWTIEGDIVAQAVGSANTILQVNGEMDISPVASGSFGTTRASSMFAGSATTVNNEINQYLELWAACSVSAAGNTMTVQQFKVYLEN